MTEERVLDLAAATAGLRTWLGEHVSLTAALVTSIVVPLRLLGVSGWNESTALAILQNADTSSILVGTALTLVTFVVGIGLLGVTAVVALVPVPDRTARRLWWAGVPLALLTLFVPMGVRDTGLAIAFWVLARAIRRAAPPHPLVVRPAAMLRDAIRWVAVAAVLLGVVFAVFLGVAGDQMWLPSETVRLANDDIQYGYVLSDGDDVVLLNAGHVLHLPGPAKARVICRLPHRDTERSIVAALGIDRTAPYPVCATSLV